VDEEGIQVDAGIALARDARIAYVTPSHQFPLGMSMSLKRRIAILDWARQAKAYILEDDYDSEYRFDGRPLAPLYALDQHDSVIYIGSFSKVLFPGLRVGYVIVPPALVDAFTSSRRAISGHLPRLEQAVLSDFIVEEHFTRHIRRMRTLYAERRAALLEAARGLPLELDVPHTGLHLIGWLPAGVDDQVAAAAAAAHQVDVMPVSTFAMRPLPRGGFALGYGIATPPEIQEGMRRLSAAIHSLSTM
jgi:GntR family transcriptional regulator/MocR family aminotransferase